MKKLSAKILIFLAAVDAVFWAIICFDRIDLKTKIYFLNVGQGDAELVVFGNGKLMLIDGGPDGTILERLGPIMRGRKYIDLVVVSHAHEDHFRGILGVLQNYSVGAVLATNSVLRNEEMMRMLDGKECAVAALQEKDGIFSGNDRFEVFSPGEFSLPQENEKSLVMKFVSEKLSVIFSGDIGVKTEEMILKKYGRKIAADILKVSHHGSKNSSSEAFINTVRPAVSVIEVGRNQFGLPSEETIEKLAAVGTKIFLTADGSFEVVVEKEKIIIGEAK